MVLVFTAWISLLGNWGIVSPQPVLGFALATSLSATTAAALTSRLLATVWGSALMDQMKPSARTVRAPAHSVHYKSNCSLNGQREMMPLPWPLTGFLPRSLSLEIADEKVQCPHTADVQTPFRAYQSCQRSPNDKFCVKSSQHLRDLFFTCMMILETRTLVLIWKGVSEVRFEVQWPSLQESEMLEVWALRGASWVTITRFLHISCLLYMPMLS